MDLLILALQITALLPGSLCLLTVLVPPLVEVKIGDQAVIPCTPKFDRTPTYSTEWFVTDHSGERRRVSFHGEGGSGTDPGTEYSDRAVMGSDLSLVIKKVRLTDEKTFHCRVSAGSAGSVGSAEARAELRVYDPPEVPELIFTSGILSVTESVASEIGSCISRNSYPAPTIEWHKNQNPLNPPTDPNKDLYVTSRTVTEASGLFTVSSTLFLRPSKQDIDALFSCQVLYPLPGGRVGNMESRERNLTLHYYTEDVQFRVMSALPIKEGDSVSLRCVGDGYPPPAYIISWLKGDSEVEKVSGPEGGYTMRNISREDTGSYRCQALDFDSPSEVNLTRELQLYVNYLDTPSLIPSESVTVSVGRDIPLSCSGDGSEAPNLRWKRAEHVLSESSRFRLRNVSYSDSGAYTCEATAPGVPGLRREQSIMVIVEGAPQLEPGDDMVEVSAEGDTVTLTCSALGHPETELIWSPPNLQGSRAVSGLRVVSEVSLKVSSQLIGGVSCTAKNRFGSSKKNFTLRIAGPTAPPTAPAAEQRGGSSTAVIAVSVCVLLLLLVVALFYFLQKRGKLTCGGGEKQSLAPDPAAAELAVELKSDKRNEQRGLLGSRGGGGQAAEC